MCAKLNSGIKVPAWKFVFQFKFTLSLWHEGCLLWYNSRASRLRILVLTFALSSVSLQTDRVYSRQFTWTLVILRRFLKKGKSLQDILQDEQQVDKNVEESCPDLF